MVIYLCSFIPHATVDDAGPRLLDKGAFPRVSISFRLVHRQRVQIAIYDHFGDLGDLFDLSGPCARDATRTTRACPTRCGSCGSVTACCALANPAPTATDQQSRPGQNF